MVGYTTFENIPVISLIFRMVFLQSLLTILQINAISRSVLNDRPFIGELFTLESRSLKHLCHLITSLLENLLNHVT